MDYRDDDLSSFRDGHWKVQPRWVKLLSVLVGIPAWIALVADGLILGNFGGKLNTAAFTVFAAVCLIQLVFVFRAYWRMDL